MQNTQEPASVQQKDPSQQECEELIRRLTSRLDWTNTLLAEKEETKLQNVLKKTGMQYRRLWETDISHFLRMVVRTSQRRKRIAARLKAV